MANPYKILHKTYYDHDGILIYETRTDNLVIAAQADLLEERFKNSKIRMPAMIKLGLDDNRDDYVKLFNVACFGSLRTEWRDELAKMLRDYVIDNLDRFEPRPIKEGIAFSTTKINHEIINKVLDGSFQQFPKDKLLIALLSCSSLRPNMTVDDFVALLNRDLTDNLYDSYNYAYGLTTNGMSLRFTLTAEEDFSRLSEVFDTILENGSVDSIEQVEAISNIVRMRTVNFLNIFDSLNFKYVNGRFVADGQDVDAEWLLNVINMISNGVAPEYADMYAERALLNIKVVSSDRSSLANYLTVDELERFSNVLETVEIIKSIKNYYRFISDEGLVSFVAFLIVKGSSDLVYDFVNLCVDDKGFVEKILAAKLSRAAVVELAFSGDNIPLDLYLDILGHTRESGHKK